jgi:hypothetical protein
LSEKIKLQKTQLENLNSNFESLLEKVYLNYNKKYNESFFKDASKLTKKPIQDFFDKLKRNI